MTGSLQVKNNIYYAVINLTDQNGKRKQKWISSKLETKGNKRKAEQFLRDKIKEYELKQNIIPTDILFSDYVLHWLNIKKPSIDVVTYQGYKIIINAHIVPYFKSKGIKLNDLTRNHIQCYIDEKLKNGHTKGKGGLSAKTVRSHIVIIKQVLKEALKNEFILSNPSEFVDLPKIQHFEGAFYSEKQISELLKLTENEPLHELIKTTVIFGLRRSEVLGLKWDSINFDNNTVTIKHTVVQNGVLVEKDSTKNKSSYRSYPMPDDMKIMFLKLKEIENTNSLLFGREYIKNDYVFKRPNGQPYPPNYISHKFKDILQRYNLPIIRFHDLRHTCASLLLAKGCSMKEIQDWLGHSDYSTTANIYSHLDVDRKNDIANLMSNF